LFNRTFTDAVRHRLINVMATAMPAIETTDKAIDGVSVFLDYQNFYFVLKNGFKVPPKQTNIPALLREFVESHGMLVKDIFLYTGIPDKTRDPVGHQEMEKRLSFWRRSGVKVRALPVLYIHNRSTGNTTVREKGIDVTLASELVRSVMDGANRILVVSNDKDIAQSVRIAGEVALSKKRKLEAFSVIPSEVNVPELRMSGLGVDGVHFTRRLELSASLVRKHVSYLERAAQARLDNDTSSFEELSRS